MRKGCWDFSYLVLGFSAGELTEPNHVALVLEFNINHVEKGFMLLDPGIGCPLIILYEANKLFPYKRKGTQATAVWGNTEIVLGTENLVTFPYPFQEPKDWVQLQKITYQAIIANLRGVILHPGEELRFLKV